MKLQPRTCLTHRANDQPTRTILVVKDEPFVREVTCSILQSAGFAVLPAEDANAALKRYEEVEGRVDLVMTDMVLPGRTGEQLGQELRQRAPNLKVLITSGYSGADFASDESQDNYFLAKPYSRTDLVGKIAEIFEVVPLHRAAGHAS